MRAIVEANAREIVQAFERLSADSRYLRFMQHKRRLSDAALQRGVHPRPGREFAFVATIPAADGIDIVGAAQYVRANEVNEGTCEFAITVAEDWRGSGLASALLASLVRRARRDGYEAMEGWVIAENTAMLRLAQKLGFKIEPILGTRPCYACGAHFSAWRGAGSAKGGLASAFDPVAAFHTRRNRTLARLLHGPHRVLRVSLRDHSSLGSRGTRCTRDFALFDTRYFGMLKEHSNHACFAQHSAQFPDHAVVENDDK